MSRPPDYASKTKERIAARSRSSDVGPARAAPQETSHLALVELAPQPSSKRRLLSLDALRGLTILLMLLVNNVALDSKTPKQLMHAPWNGGVHLADLVFPWFLFCMGLAVPFSMDGMAAKGMGTATRMGRVLFRAAALFALGCLIDSVQAGSFVIGLDVLQLLGLAYLFAALFYPLHWQARLIVVAALLAGYGLALTLIPYPPAGKPMFEEGRNLVAHVNTSYLARFKLSGLLSVIPTTALVLLAASLTRALRAKAERQSTQLWLLLVSGVVLSIAGIAWNEALPYNKTVWTPSYILLSAGLGCLLLAALYWLLDVRQWNWLAYPFLVFGSNALLAYVGPVLVKLVILQEVRMPSGLTLQKAWLATLVERLGQVPGGWAYTVSYIAVVWLVLAMLYHRRWFLRV